MEVIHEIIRESVSGGFWRFCGYWILISLMLGIPAKVVLGIFSLFFDYLIDRQDLRNINKIIRDDFIIT